ncbi:hypothetical protein DPMN_020738 [Dreissena polymorpha]|uniref:Uncharacterized protein n=1 Tax=Dreissena polymorpha TaxID=45954 RepID=A0A9D4NLP3_DREPO|nr:hypothetical protein DPMN_020738 [Dreissena polymorpha]
MRWDAVVVSFDSGAAGAGGGGSGVLATPHLPGLLQSQIYARRLVSANGKNIE